MELGFLWHGQGQCLNRLHFPFEVARKFESDLYVFDARCGDHVHLIPVATCVPGFDPVTEVTRRGSDRVFAAAVGDRQLNFAWFSIAGAEIELRGVGNDAGHTDGDLGAVALLHHQIL